MSTVRPFNKERIIEYAKNNGRHYLTDDEGDIVIRFGNGDVSFQCWVLAKGSNSNVLHLMALRDKNYERTQWASLLEACNQFNSEYRWPSAYLRMDGNSGRVVCEWSVDLEQGVHQELLDDMIETFIGSTLMFWKWMRDERGLY